MVIWRGNCTLRAGPEGGRCPQSRLRGWNPEPGRPREVADHPSSAGGNLVGCGNDFLVIRVGAEIQFLGQFCNFVIHFREDNSGAGICGHGFVASHGIVAENAFGAGFLDTGHEQQC